MVILLYQTRELEFPMLESFSAFLYGIAVSGSDRDLTYGQTSAASDFSPFVQLDPCDTISPCGQDNRGTASHVGESAWGMLMNHAR